MAEEEKAGELKPADADGTPNPLDDADDDLSAPADLKGRPVSEYFRPLIRGVFICKLSEVALAKSVDFRLRGITHVLLLANSTVSRFPRVVQMLVATQDVNDFDLLSHLGRCLAFVENGREVGGVLICDKTGGAEGAAVFVAFLMKLGMSLVDGLRFLKRRLKSARANAGFEEQLGLFETWDGISHQNIKRRDILDLFPNAAVPADDGNSVNSELTLWDSDFEPELEHKELNNKLAREAAASKKDAFESKMKSRRAAEFAAEHSSDEDDVPVRTVDSEDLIEARPKWVRRKRYSEAEPGSNGTTWSEYTDPITSAPFWYNPATDESRWTAPVAEYDNRGKLIGTIPVIIPGIGEVPKAPLLSREEEARKSLVGRQSTVSPAATSAMGSTTAADQARQQHRRRSSVTLSAAPNLQWQQLYDMDAEARYWYNSVTGASQWERPDDYLVPIPPEQPTIPTLQLAGATAEQQDTASVDKSASGSQVHATSKTEESGAEELSVRSGTGAAAAEGTPGNGGSGAEVDHADGVPVAGDGSTSEAASTPAGTAPASATTPAAAAAYSEAGTSSRRDSGGLPEDATAASARSEKSTPEEKAAESSRGSATERTRQGTARSARSARSDFDDLASIGDDTASVGGSSVGGASTSRSKSRGGSRRRKPRGDKAAAAEARRRKLAEEEEARKVKKKAPRITRFLDEQAEFKVNPSGNAVRRVKFYRDGDHIMASDDEGNVKMMIWRSGGIVARLAQSPMEPTHRAWCLDIGYGFDLQKTVYTMSYNGDLKVWENPVQAGKTLSKGAEVMPTMYQHLHGKLVFEKAPTSDPRAYRACSFSISRDQSLLLVTSETGHLRFYGTPKAKADVSRLRVPVMGWIAGWNLLATYKGLHSQWDAAGNPATTLISKVAVSPDKRFVVTGGLDGKLFVWSLDMRLLRTLPPHRHPRRCSHGMPVKEASQNESYLDELKKRTAGNVHMERHLDKLENKYLRYRKKYKHDEPDASIYDIVWHDNSKLIAVATEGGFLSIWNVCSGKRVWRTGVSKAYAVGSINAFKPQLLAGASMKTVNKAVDDTETSQPQKHSGGSGKGAKKSTKSSSKKVTPAESSKKRATASGKDAAKAPSKGKAESASKKVSDTQGPPVADGSTEPEMIRAPVNCVAYSPDMKYLVAGTSDSWLKVYNADTGDLLCSIDTPAEVNGVAFSPGSNAVAAAMSNGRIGVYAIRDKLSAITRVCEESSQFKCTIS